VPRKHFSQRERVRLFTLNGGKCHLCHHPIKVGDAWEIEHEIAWELTRDDSDENLKLAHIACHKVKTADDVRSIRKADRMKAKHIGAWPEPRGNSRIQSRAFPKRFEK
jgi:5-methylcytosine-specific restriction enzyme A